MSFTRHVGKQGDRKVAVVFREVPGESHMCLVVFTEVLNQNIHDPLIQCIESDIGQNSENLADALNRSYTKDGTIILQKLHAEGMLKKVQTASIIMTPAPNVKIKLEELNKILDEMKLGEDATRKLAEMDSQLGIQSPINIARKMKGKDAVVTANSDVLGNEQLATNYKSQAERMTREANGLLAEAKRLTDEAQSLTPVPVKATKVTKVKATTTKTKTKKVAPEVTS